MPRRRRDRDDNGDDGHYDNDGPDNRNRNHDNDDGPDHHGGWSLTSACGIRSVNEYVNKAVDDSSDEDEDWYQAKVKGGPRAYIGAGIKKKGAYRNVDWNAGADLMCEDGHRLAGVNVNQNAEIGAGGAIYELEGDATYYSYTDKQGSSIELAKGYLGGGLGAGVGGVKCKAEAGVDLVREKLKFSGGKELTANVGLNADTGVEVGVDGVGASFLGFGGMVGRRTGINTPFGGISFKFW